MAPVCAAAGTRPCRLVALGFGNTGATPAPKVTAVRGAGAKLLPVMFTTSPALPLAGLKPRNVGGYHTVKSCVLSTCPPSV